MKCILCGADSVVLWSEGRERIRQCETGHYWNSTELVTGPVDGPVPRGEVPIKKLLGQE